MWGFFERRKVVTTCEIAMVYLGKEGFYAIDKKSKIIKSEHMKPRLRVCGGYKVGVRCD